jgi:hypothetical protein
LCLLAFQKIRELEVIDKARSAELRTIMPEKKTE